MVDLDITKELSSMEKDSSFRNAYGVDLLIIKIIIFFCTYENWNFNTIENLLIPNILKHSNLFNGGRKLDFTHLSGITDPCLSFLPRLFKGVTSMKINSQNRINTLSYLAEFKSLEKLEISVSEHDNFITQNIILNIKSLKIIATPQNSMYQCINQILNCTPSLNQFKLSGGNLTAQTIINISNPLITTISLHNTKIIPQLKEMLYNLFIRDHIRELKLVLTDHKSYNMPFLEAVNEFFSKIIFNNTLEQLTFTLDPCCEQQLENLSFLTGLKRIKIYFSVQYDIRKLICIIPMLLRLRLQQIIFKEYYDPPRSGVQLTSDYYCMLKQRSRGCKQLLESAHSSISVIEYDFKI